MGNIKKETSALWYKDGREIKADEKLAFTEGVLKLEIAQVRRRLNQLHIKLINIVTESLFPFRNDVWLKHEYVERCFVHELCFIASSGPNPCPSKVIAFLDASCSLAPSHATIMPVPLKLLSRYFPTAARPTRRICRRPYRENA